MFFLAWIDISHLYLFLLIIQINPVFSCSSNSLPSSVDRVTTGTCNLASRILNVVFVGLLIAGLSLFASFFALLLNTQFADHVTVEDISQLISGISSVFQKVTKMF